MNKQPTHIITLDTDARSEARAVVLNRDIEAKEFYIDPPSNDVKDILLIAFGISPLAIKESIPCSWTINVFKFKEPVEINLNNQIEKL